MSTRRALGACLAVAALAGTATTACDKSSADTGGQTASAPSVTPEQISTVVRWNATDDDAQVWLTAVSPELAMATITVHTPDGRAIFTERLDRTGVHGQERLEHRSSEHSLEDLEEIYPAGEYRWTGRTSDGERIRGTTEVVYELPDAPTILTPADEATEVPVDGAVVTWEPVQNAQWILAEVEVDGDGRELLIRLEGTATSLNLPAGYLQPGTDYEVELKAIHPNGNQAARDSVFTTA